MIDFKALAQVAGPVVVVVIQVVKEILSRQRANGVNLKLDDIHVLVNSNLAKARAEVAALTLQVAEMKAIISTLIVSDASLEESKP